MFAPTRPDLLIGLIVSAGKCRGQVLFTKMFPLCLLANELVNWFNCGEVYGLRVGQVLFTQMFPLCFLVGYRPMSW